MNSSVTLVIATPGFGGAERHTLQLAEGLCRRGWKVRLLHLGPDGGERMLSESRPIPLDWSYVPIYRPDGSGDTARRTTALRRILREISPPVHVIMTDPVAYWHIAAALRLMGRRALIAFHGVRPFVPFRLREKILFSSVFPAVYSPPLRIVALSTPNRRLLARGLRRKEEDILLIPNGFDAAPFDRARDRRRQERRRLGLEDSDFVIAALGRLSKEKRPEWFVALSEELRNRGVSHRLLIAGDGPLREQIEKRAAATDAVRLLGPVSPVHGFLAAADVYVLASLYEGLPYSLLEAMAARCVPVCTPAGGVVDVIEEGRTGYIVGSIQEMADRVEQLRKDTDLRLRLGNAARDCVQRRFRIEDMIQGYVNAYEGA